MEYEVLNPWAEIDPVIPKGLEPRLTDLNGKTIGLFAFFKPHGIPIMKEVERQLRERFPGAKFSLYSYPVHATQVIEDQGYKDSFVKWVKGVDAVVSGHGD
jgi:hypothetical protein